MFCKFILVIPNLFKSTQKLLIMRHGERVDFTFGDWIPHCFDAEGRYIRRDLNLPSSLPSRSLGPRGFAKDSPLTRVGIFQASSIGEALKEAGVDLQHVYCSPSFRCIQTCDAVLGAFENKPKMKIEPGLFEALAYYPNGLPNWFDPHELIAAGYNIDATYVPFILQNDLLNSGETLKDYWQRSEYITKSVLDINKSGNILFVAHATSLDLCSRQLRRTESTKFLERVPYCSLIAFRRNGETWDYTEPPTLPITHSSNDRFDWKVLKY